MDATGTQATHLRAAAIARAAPAVGLALVPLIPRSVLSSWSGPTIATGMVAIVAFSWCWPTRRPAAAAVAASTVVAGVMVVPRIGLLVGSLLAAGLVVTGASGLLTRGAPATHMSRLVVTVSYAMSMGVILATPRVVAPTAMLLSGLVVAAVLERLAGSSRRTTTQDDRLAPLIERAMRTVGEAGRMYGADPTNPFGSPRARRC